jgi:hypothetical protein
VSRYLPPKVNLDKYCKGLTFNIQDVILLADPVEESDITSEHSAVNAQGILANTHPKISEFFKKIQSNLEEEAAKEAAEIGVRSDDNSAGKSYDSDEKI